MENLRLSWPLAVVIGALCFACSHEDRNTAREEARDEARATRTSGAEVRARADRDRDNANGALARRDRDDDDDDDLDLDDHDGAPTAFDQSNEDGDLAITQAIRQAVVRDDSLSFTARNVTIITNGSNVTLRGSVNTEAERETIERHARSVDGVGNVENLIDVAP